MSIVIALNAGYYVLVASDVRASYFDDQLREIREATVELKMRRTPVGLITGSGFGPLLDTVKDRFCEQVPEDTAAVVRMIESAAQETLGLDMPFAWKDQALNFTSWVFTDTTADGMPELCLYHPKFNAGVVSLLRGACVPVVPDLTADGVEDRAAVRESLGEVLAKYRVVCEGPPDVNGTLSANVSLVRQCIVQASKCIPSISPECQIGIHLAGGQVLLSGIVGVDAQTIEWVEDDPARDERRES